MGPYEVLMRVQHPETGPMVAVLGSYGSHDEAMKNLHYWVMIRMAAVEGGEVKGVYHPDKTHGGGYRVRIDTPYGVESVFWVWYNEALE